MHENLELNEPVTELDNLQKHCANIIQVKRFFYFLEKSNKF